MSRLELTWVGKNRRERPEPRILLEQPALSYHAAAHRPGDLFENLLIQGDNLLGLRALESDHAGRVKCAFIDPPYNTGAAFEHFDDGYEHSIWLSLMKERLERIYTLLRNDGSLWITIDDHEAHYLKVLCDEIFGRQNFISNIVWQKKYTVANDTKYFSDQHDHILVYAKVKADWRPNRLPRSAAMDARYANPDRHKKGPWKATPLHAKSGSPSSRAFRHTFSNGVVWAPPPGAFPRFSSDTLAQLEANNEIWFGRDGKALPSRKTFLSDLSSEGVPAATVWLHSEVGNNHEAKTEAKEFNTEQVFDTPKPERLLHRVLYLATNPGDLVLDSFAGSGTTGAVAHKLGRRWIMLELGEHARTHIVPRLRKVIDGDDPGGVTQTTNWTGGGGFRFYRLAPSLLEYDKWGREVISKAYNPEMLAEALCKLEGFTYAPSETEYWNHGHSTERDFIYVTTQTLTHDQLRDLSEQVGPDRTLLVLCAAYRGDVRGLGNLTVKKLPDHVRDRCEWGRDDYSLAVEALPPAPERPAATPATRGARVGVEPDLFTEPAK